MLPKGALLLLLLVSSSLLLVSQEMRRMAVEVWPRAKVLLLLGVSSLRVSSQNLSSLQASCREQQQQQQQQQQQEKASDKQG
jgi:hypothetical protein